MVFPSLKMAIIANLQLRNIFFIVWANIFAAFSGRGLPFCGPPVNGSKPFEGLFPGTAGGGYPSSLRLFCSGLFEGECRGSGFVMLDRQVLNSLSMISLMNRSIDTG